VQAVAALLLILTSFTSTRAEATGAGVAGFLSIVPGLGQVANGDALEGAGWFITTTGLFFSGNKILGQVGYDLWQYNMYDAYRDAKPTNRRYQDHNVFQNYFATFNPLNIIDPIGAPVVGLGAVVGSRNHYKGIRNPTYIPYFGFIGLGEEGLFRGFLFPGFSEVMGTVPSAIFTSALFALFHITNGKGALGAGPLTSRFVMGLLFCWQVHLNDYDLRKSIFAHAWWDIFVAPGSPRGVKIDGGVAGWKFRF
jgi:hypothetical protein